MNEGRHHDPRRLSRLKPGRSEIQDEVPPIAASKNNRDPEGDLRRNEKVGIPISASQMLRNRALRRQGAMPPGTGGGPSTGN